MKDASAEVTIATSDACPLCGRCESIDRLLFSCNLLQPLWDQLTSLHQDRPYMQPSPCLARCFDKQNTINCDHRNPVEYMFRAGVARHSWVKNKTTVSLQDRLYRPWKAPIQQIVRCAWRGHPMKRVHYVSRQQSSVR